MLFVLGLLCALPAGVVWVVKNDFGAAVVTWWLCMIAIIVYFFGASGEPTMATGMGLFVAWVLLSRWWIFGRQPQGKPLQQIILSPPAPTSFLGWVQSVWDQKLSPWIAAVFLAGVSIFLGMAWMMGSSSPYESPQEKQRLDEAMGQNSVKATDPAEAYRESMDRQRFLPKQPTKSWSDTDDLADWSKYVQQ